MQQRLTAMKMLSMLNCLLREKKQLKVDKSCSTSRSVAAMIERPSLLNLFLLLVSNIFHFRFFVLSQFARLLPILSKQLTQLKQQS